MTVKLIFSDNVKETKWFRRDLVCKALEVFEVDSALISIPEVALRLDLSTIDKERPVYRQI